jgi:AbiTii
VLKNERLKTWAQHELNGYEDDSDLPSNRRIGAHAKGTFAGQRDGVDFHLAGDSEIRDHRIIELLGTVRNRVLRL